MKVALFTQGYADYVIQLANALSEKIEVILFMSYSDLSGKKISQISDKVIIEKYFSYNLLNFRNFYQMLDVGKRIKQYNPNVVHIQSHGNLWFFIVFIILSKYKVVNTIHDVTPHLGEKNAFKYRIMAFIGVFFTGKFIIHGNYLKKKFESRFNLNKDNIIKIAHGDYLIYDSYSEKNFVRERNTILFFGRLWEYKGLKYLIRSEPLIKTEIPDLKIILAVHGEPLEIYDPYFVNRDSFEIHNYLIPDEDVASFFERSSLVIIPYIEASQSGVISLAYSFGRPVVATKVGSLPEVMVNGKTGFLVEPKDEKSLATAIIRILKDRKLYNFMSDFCLNYAKHRMSWEKISTETIKVYKEE